jgi:aspartyl-tRNA(Asn)/glutamyl-tRNA(Gln) amidotransferase subunit C
VCPITLAALKPIGTDGLQGKTALCYRAMAIAAFVEGFMSVDANTVRKIARLARIAVPEEEVAHLQDELNAILAFVEQLSTVTVADVEPMTSVIPMKMKPRPDIVTEGGDADAILKNAPVSVDHFFSVPRVVE